MIKNEQFWSNWREGKFNEALQCSIEDTPKRKGAALFKKQEHKETAIISSLSAGEFLYDYLMIDPEVVVGLDFARAEDLSNLFTLSQFAGTIDTSAAIGDMAQLQGYVAERMIAQELVAAGHDVQFPHTSNQAGWDLLVDGQPFQVKCAASKSVVEEHFEKYPDTPVYVNAELGKYYEENPLVFTSSVTREQVIADTKTTLYYADDLLDFQIPWIAAGVSAFYNTKRIRNEGIMLSTAARNVVADTASRATLAVAGKTALGAVGAVVLPGAGAIVFPVIGAYVGMSQGYRVSHRIKRAFAQVEEAALCHALHQLIKKMQSVLKIKFNTKQTKWKQLSSNLHIEMAKSMSAHHEENIQLLENVNRELAAIDKEIDHDPMKAFERIVNALGKAGIHVYTLKEELKAVEEAILSYTKKI
ncbi:hypothetical protein [Lysinibacillus sp. LZ02]|uniref:hypothetical protein n=1 Tax=Lysinibacillus sp. LZ02 TaxID=3420668 RepID=UPI003D35A4F2